MARIVQVSYHTVILTIYSVLVLYQVASLGGQDSPGVPPLHCSQLLCQLLHLHSEAEATQVYFIMYTTEHGHWTYCVQHNFVLGSSMRTLDIRTCVLHIFTVSLY